MSVGIDEDALEDYSDKFDDARTTSEIRKRMTDSSIVRDTTKKCNVEAQFTSNGNINIVIDSGSLNALNVFLGAVEMFYEAIADSDGPTCADRAKTTANNINDLVKGSANRNRRQTVDDDVDPIFNFVTVATTLEESSADTTEPPSGGADVIIASYCLLFASMLLAVLMF